MQLLKGLSRVVKKPVVKSILAIALYDVLIFSLFLIVNPNTLSWLFDDKYVLTNDLAHYVDFRPGHPPIGKLPYTYLYKAFGSAEIIVLYNLATADLTLIALYKLLKGMAPRRKAIALTSIVAFHPVFIWAIILHPHADTLALFWLVLAIYFIWARRPLGTGLSIALGFLTKIYHAVLLVPALLLFKKWDRIVLVSSFLSIVVLVSAPYLASDPLMYATTYLHHLSRGPSESIFALLDGYYSHTGFPRPTFDAMIYAWQFNAVYTPSNIDHFNYVWSNPHLRYISFILQVSYLLMFSILAGRVHHEVEATRAVALSMLSYFVFSPFWNPIIALPTLILLILVTLHVKTVFSLLALICLAAIDQLHLATWFLGTPLGVRMGLLTVVTSRALLISTMLYVAGKTVRWGQWGEQ